MEESKRKENNIHSKEQHKYSTFFVPLLLHTVDGRFGHGRFGLGCFGLGRFGHGRFGQAIFKGGRFGQIYIFRRFI